MKVKKIFSILLITLFILTSVIGCGGNTEQKDKTGEQGVEKEVEKAKPVTIKLGHTSAPGTGIYLTFEKFKEIVEAKSEGQLLVDIFPSGQLGGDQDSVEATKQGSIDICSAGTNNMSPFTDLFLFSDLPYVMRSIEGSHKVYSGQIGEEIKEKTEGEVGLKLLFYADPGSFRDVMNTKHEVKVPADMKGLKFRSAASPIEQAVITAFGANPTPVSWPETYMALEQKVVDGEMQQYQWVVTAGHQDVIKYVCETGGIQAVHLALMSLEKFESLSPEFQQIILDAAKEAQKYNFDNAEKWNGELKAKVVEAGVQFYTPTDAEMELWMEAGMTVYEQFADKISPEFIKRILAEQGF